MPVKVIVSANLRNILANRKVTSSQVAYLLGKPVETVEEWLQGTVMPEDCAIHRISEIFGVAPSSFYIDFAAHAPGETWTISVAKLNELGLSVTKDPSRPIKIERKRDP